MQTIVDIAIVGAGIVGTTCATLLAKQGFKVALIDASKFNQWQANEPITRVSSFNQAARRLFQHLDIWQSLTPYACGYDHIHVWQQGTPAYIDFHSQQNGYHQFACIIQNNLVSYLLVNQLRQNYKALLMPNTTVDGIDQENAILYFSDGRQVQSQLIIAADGACSKIRQLCHVRYDSHDYQQHAIVTNITLENHNALKSATAWQNFLTTGPLALLPLYNGNYSIVWSCAKEAFQELSQLNDSDFQQRLSDIVSTKIGAKVIQSDARFNFPIIQRHCHQYVHDKVALIGDAAHTTHPLAGIGANLGLLDAAALCQILNDAKSQRHAINKPSTLAQYQRWRHPENSLALKAMYTLNQSFSRKNDKVHYAAGEALKMTNCAPFLKQYFAKVAMANTGDLPEICRPRW